MKIRSLFIVLLIIVSYSVNAQAISFKNLFQKKDLLQKDFHAIASSYQLLQLDSQQLASARLPAGQKMSLSLPFENRDLELDLSPAVITRPDFSVIEGLAGGATRVHPYSLPSFYRGTIKGQHQSFATVSISNNQLIGILSDSRSTIVLGAIEQNGRATSQYALYRDIDLNIKGATGCFTDDVAIGEPAVNSKVSRPAARALATGQPIEIYFECDYKFYQDKGSNVNNVVNYVLGFFNSVALIYANEDIQVQVSQIKVWTTPDPYVSLTNTGSVLSAFSTAMATDPYVGEFAHFLSTRSLGGGIAFLLSNPCATARANRTAVSAVNNTFSNFPTYSWTVNVVTHELGHNFGSHHTHWCGWPGGPIDWCAPTANVAYTEGTCTAGPLPPAGGGTIMSYCHLLGGVGINLTNGFGTLPGNAIRTVIGAAGCFGTCKMTISSNAVNASCGQNNGSVSITPAHGTGIYSYLWSDGQTGATLTNAAPGIYNVTVTDGSGCKAMTADTIINSGSTLPVILTPSTTASFCTGNTLLLSATNNPSYSYKWYNNNVIINGATSATYIAATGGTYSVEVTSGICTVTKTVTVSQVTQPSANIVASGPTNFCTGNSVVLSANPASGYQYEWFRNGVVISGATTNIYTASVAGNYTVRVYSGSCESTSSAQAVTVMTSPAAGISAGGPLNFCNGGSVELTADSGSGYSYQWYRNSSIINGATDRSYAAAAAGDYTVQTSLGTCSKLSAAIPVTLLPNPVVLISPDSSTIKKYQTQTLTASGAVSYNWSAQPSVVSSTATSSVVEPFITTTYRIEGTAGNGCMGTGTARIIVIGCGDVTNISVRAYSPSRVLISWQNPNGSNSDSLQYRVSGSDAWNSVISDAGEYMLNGLVPGTDYEFRIIALCEGTDTFIPSDVQVFSTPGLRGVYLKLYPNPVRQIANLEIIVDKDYEMEIIVYDMAGRRVMDVSPVGTVSKGQTIKSINGFKLASGLYRLVVKVDGKGYVIGMVVQR